MQVRRSLTDDVSVDMGLLFEPSLEATTKFVYVILAAITNRVFSSMSAFEKAMENGVGLTYETIKKHLRFLSQAGYIYYDGETGEILLHKLDQIEGKVQKIKAGTVGVKKQKAKAFELKPELVKEYPTLLSKATAKEALAYYIAMRAEIGHPLTERAAKMLLNKLEDWSKSYGVRLVTEQINRSVTAQYRDVFLPQNVKRIDADSSPKDKVEGSVQSAVDALVARGGFNGKA